MTFGLMVFPSGFYFRWDIVRNCCDGHETQHAYDDIMHGCVRVCVVCISG